ncbi:MAG: tetratricopeptide repeat protein [Syntrophorhabdaceae bacterium]|nr:tetratricopeptide repeat protein [Syntrophorhabdaceae bacterium]
MARRKVKEEVKKPDFLVKAFEYTVRWIKGNLKICLIGLIIFVVLLSATIFGTIYINKQHDKAQFVLSQAISAYREYDASGSEEALKKAEELFGKAVNEKRGQVATISKLYLGKIYTIKGKIEEAKRLYREVIEEAKDSTIKSFAENALPRLEKK